MNVEELIEALKRMPDPKQEVKVKLPKWVGSDDQYASIDKVLPENQLRFGTKIVCE